VSRKARQRQQPRPDMAKSGAVFCESAHNLAPHLASYASLYGRVPGPLVVVDGVALTTGMSICTAAGCVAAGA
jgi:hypothetical protein